MKQATSLGKGHYLEWKFGQLMFRQEATADDVIGLIVAVAGQPDPDGTGRCPAKRECEIPDLVTKLAGVPMRYGKLVKVLKKSSDDKQEFRAVPGTDLLTSATSIGTYKAHPYWVKIQWLDSLDPVLTEDTETNVKLTDLDLATFVGEQRELAVEYCFDNYGESTDEVMRCCPNSPLLSPLTSPARTHNRPPGCHPRYNQPRHGQAHPAPPSRFDRFAVFGCRYQQLTRVT